MTELNRAVEQYSEEQANSVLQSGTCHERSCWGSHTEARKTLLTPEPRLSYAPSAHTSHGQVSSLHTPVNGPLLNTKQVVTAGLLGISQTHVSGFHIIPTR